MGSWDPVFGATSILVDELLLLALLMGLKHKHLLAPDYIMKITFNTIIFPMFPIISITTVNFMVTRSLNFSAVEQKIN